MNEKDFIKKWIEKIDNGLKNFPNDFLSGIETYTFKMPGKPITLGSELFGVFEIVDTDGNVILQTDDYNFIKYVLYSNRFKPSEILVPNDISDISKIVKEYGSHLDLQIKEIKLELSEIIPTSDFMKVSNQIFNSINLQRY